ncbi:hypothetical protein [Methylobacterium frigidaeris]|uniref:Flagellar protein FlhE n=1 Tax=Methylobacterium frigidaeris TaxID=2038277 RepID=A0AA37HAC1_9HYPH|nr:hypothetical protein [Methylobacterium frigidaeris]PIK73303.1 hypothetical protein CS379_09160 [Methylobacterium frigidaeris]GJD62132.1 hypothetical protein MPEAHAMD_2281 [Methylobacterium frigidaeris]
MKKLAYLSLLPALLTGAANAQPAPIFAIPVTGQLTNGIAAAGQATGYRHGLGEFWVAFPGSIRCTGTWSVRDPNPTIVMPVTCGARVRGEAIVTRQPGFMTGSAIVALSNGQRGQFVFGDLTYEQAFGQGRVRTR